MNKDKLRLWIDALRSGEYEQGVGQLSHRGGDRSTYCCLGVACEVAAKDGLWLDVVRKESGSVSYSGCSSYLPFEAEEWLGWSGERCNIYISQDVANRVGTHLNTPLTGWDEGVGVTHLNDSLGFTFAQIADCLELEFLS